MYALGGVGEKVTRVVSVGIAENHTKRGCEGVGVMGLLEDNTGGENIMSTIENLGKNRYTLFQKNICVSMSINVLHIDSIYIVQHKIYISFHSA